MTKPKIIQSLLAQASKELNALTTQRDGTENEITKLNQEINRLNTMPVCREDFSILLKESIAAYTQKQSTDLTKCLMHQVQGSYYDDGSTITKPVNAANQRGLKELENPVNWLLSGWSFSGNPLGSDTISLKTLLWLFPDQIHAKIMQAIETEIGAKWGNDDLPRLADRRERIADLTAELAEQQTKLDEINAAIAEISRLTEKNSWQQHKQG